MELTDSSDVTARSPFFIDLNEIPSSSSSSPPSIAPPESGTRPGPDPNELDSIDIVRSFHENQDPALGTAAGLPEEVNVPLCGACGKAEARMDDVVVCDGCERGFHLRCAGVNGREEEVAQLADWICTECANNDVKSKRWPLGVNKRILDINASPPSDCDGDGESFAKERKHVMGGNSFGGNTFGVPVKCSNRFSMGNGFAPFDLGNGSGLIMKPFRVGVDDVLHHTVDESLEHINLGFLRGGGLRSNKNTANRLSSQSPNEIFLQGLRDFISERNGKLEEGWHVELKHSMSGYEVCVAYCSPDGKTFGSMFEVACYLGLASRCNAMESDARSDGSPCLQERLHLPKKRKSKRFPHANGYTENKEASVHGCHKGDLSNGHRNVEIGDPRTGKVMEADTEEEDIDKSVPSDDGLPVQFEDFFIISLGKIDKRPSYHDHQVIWPIGYKSCWHDKVTGSIFVCEVLDGGDSGPVFMVRRFSCSVMPLPDSSTILYRKNPDQFADEDQKAYDDVIYSDMHYNDEDYIEMFLADISPPTEDDIVSCLRHASSRTCDIQTSGRGGNRSSNNLKLEDEIGEFTVEEHSSSSAWRLVSQKLIDIYSEICKRKGSLKLYCKHADNGTLSRIWDTEDEKSRMSFAPVAKFCSSPSLLGCPFESKGEVHDLAASLSKWLDQDRFGLDAEFVQEIIRKLPDVGVCSKYEALVCRSNYSESLTVGNGLLLAKRSKGAELDESLQRCKRPRLGNDCESDHHYPPPGCLLCSELPPVLVGDLYQVWEVLRRFQEVLGLKEPCLLRELEEELLNPWRDCANFLENRQQNVGGSHDSMSGPISSSCQESSKAVNDDQLDVLIRVEKGGIHNSDQDLCKSVTQSKCCGVALTDVHSSLLSVLIGELQSKVTALIDPNFDSGEIKLKRGRKKDVDSLIPSKRSKLTTLPINELTWPELARRYILAVLSMDGHFDSAEITARESGRVFRCLQGDGGVLCGSLVGVAGMEADALLLAEAIKQIYGSLNRENDVLTMEEELTDVSESCERRSGDDGNLPEWARMLEPVRKLPTNVGTRIRKCVYEALDKSPPEWAKKRLQHSISKEVYKGNASGPTKKAVLSVLADVSGEAAPQKPNRKNRTKITILVSDIIMKQCRIVLRRAAAADDAKVFCTLLGRNLINSCDNDDEGLLGSPAMVSRPLDFRTIDLRLAVGAYGGSHESFLEDVRELWNNVRTAFRDQPDVIELAESLSQNFESLYEKEVVTLVKKLEGFAKLDNLSAEIKKELDTVIASINEIPKAPWDEGVCKVCGVDKDDDSVLLCDTCDAEYHTYCLNPPLARIPEGNWYCPSCLGVYMVQEASVGTKVIGQKSCKKHQGEITRVYMEKLVQLEAAMEERDYWEYGVDERTFLLKFLCEELLNSALVRQHLEQCVESTAELQQKLRSLSVEWKNLKSREEFLALRSAKMGTGASGETKAGLIFGLSNQGKPVGQLPDLSDKPTCSLAASADAPAVDGNQEGTGVNGFEKNPSELNNEKKSSCDSQNIDSVNTYGQLKDGQLKYPHAAMGCNKAFTEENHKTMQLDHLPISNHSPKGDCTGETLCQGNFLGNMERESSIPLPHSSHPGSSFSLGMKVENMAMNEAQASLSELSSMKDDIHGLQNSISSIESQLFKQAMRREFLGSDSGCRLYWASATPCGHPRIIVDGSLMSELGKTSYHRLPNCSTSAAFNNCSNLESSTCFPFLFSTNDTLATSSAWFSYETDAEIEELIGWLGGSGNHKEIELKESILQWLKFRCQETRQTREPVQEECQAALSMIRNDDKTEISNCLATKAALFLERNYGQSTELDTTDMARRRGKKARESDEEKMYRCSCLELIWPSRNHCLSCHRSSLSDVEFDGHNSGRCSPLSQPCEKNEKINDCSKVRGNLKPEVTWKEKVSETDKLHTPISGLSEFGRKLIKFQRGGTKCPYDSFDICSKFVTKDSNKELVQDIGLIGSNGIPQFITSVFPYLSDSMLVFLSPEKRIKIIGDECDVDKRQVLEQEDWSEGCAVQSSSDVSDRKTSAHETSEMLETKKPAVGLSQQKGKKSSFGKWPSVMDPGPCYIVLESSLRPLVGKASFVLRQLKINLLDMEAAVPEEALRPAMGQLRRRWAWRAFVKSAESIYQMVQATIMLEEMIKSENLRNEWWYWSSLSAAAKTSTIASLALRIYSLDACIVYEKASTSDPSEDLKPSSTNPPSGSNVVENCRVTRKSNKKRKEPES